MKELLSSSWSLGTGHRDGSAWHRRWSAYGKPQGDRQAPRDEEGDRGSGASVGGDHAPHLG
jgi:hypothetical protein